MHTIARDEEHYLYNPTEQGVVALHLMNTINITEIIFRYRPTFVEGTISNHMLDTKQDLVTPFWNLTLNKFYLHLLKCVLWFLLFYILLSIYLIATTFEAHYLNLGLTPTGVYAQHSFTKM